MALRMEDNWSTTDLPDPGEGQIPARRVRGLRFPVIPTGAWLAQVGGGAAALSGVFMQFGGAVTLMVGGVSAVVLGALREAGKV